MNHKREPIAVIAITILTQCGSIKTALAASEPSTLFKTKCSSCHTFGKGDRVGPDLKGVTDRHARDWLIPWIRFQDDSAGDTHTAVTFGVHFGIGF